MQPLKVSLLIHNFNRGPKLAKCLDSVEALTYRPLEVIVLDAGSTDGSLEIINKAMERMCAKGLEARLVKCAMMGVPSSRNFAARQATGQLLLFLDNDATIGGPQAIEHVVSQFENDDRLAIVGFDIYMGDSRDVDPFAWVYRRPLRTWRARPFETFTFAGCGFCVRATAYWAVGGFWERIIYSREEEDMGMALVDRGWKLLYDPTVTVRHYPDNRSVEAVANRRAVEGTNGLLVLWRRLPAPFAVLAIAARIGSMSARALVQNPRSLPVLWSGIGKAFKDMLSAKAERDPLSLQGAFRYLMLHFQSDARTAGVSRS